MPKFATPSSPTTGATLGILDPTERLLAGLRAAVERDLRPHLDRISAVRAAVDAYEAAIRAHVEASLVQTAAGALGIDADAAPDITSVREELARAVHDLIPPAATQVEAAIAAPPEVASPATVAAWIAAQNAEPPPRPSLYRRQTSGSVNATSFERCSLASASPAC